MRFIAFTMLLAGLIAPSLAQDAAPAASPAPATAPKTLCRRMEPATGSLMPGRRVCHTAAEWERITQADRRALERVQGTVRTTN